MIREIEIENFRGIRTGSLRDFTEVVILVGPNSAGKSTVLEGLFLGAEDSPQNALNRLVQRRAGVEQPVQWLVFAERNKPPGILKIAIKSDSNIRRITSLAHQGDNREAGLMFASYYENATTGGPRRVADGRTQFIPAPHSPMLKDVPRIQLVESGQSSSPLHQLYSWAVQSGFSEQANEIAKAIIPDFIKMEVLAPHGQPSLYLIFKDGPKPLPLAGDGIRIVIQQSLEFAAMLGGVVLMEEPEVHMHPAAIRQCAKTIWAAALRGLQIFLTTHSLNLIDALISESDQNFIDKISVYRLQLSNGELKSSRYSGSESATARSLVEEDLR